MDLDIGVNFMIDLLDVVSIIFTVILISVFYLLVIAQFNGAKTKKLENLSILIAFFMGGLAFILYLIGKIGEISEPPNLDLINHSFSLMFISFTICFYFWYRHYLSILSLRYEFKSNESYMVKLFKPKTFVDIILIGGIVIGIVSYIFFFFESLGLINHTVFNFFWQALGLTPYVGRVVTLVSHITFFSGALVFTYIMTIIINNNLLELEFLTVFETIPIFLLAFINVLLFFNDLLFTYEIITYDFQLVVLNIGLLLFTLSMLSLVLDYIIENPPHFETPSIYKNQIKDNLNELKATNKLPPAVLKETLDLNALNDSLKSLNGTGIFILMYILKEQEVIAKDIENKFNIKKSTVSFCLKKLEEYNLILRKSPTESILADNKSLKHQNDIDGRKKIIIINKNGVELLQMLHLNLVENF